MAKVFISLILIYSLYVIYYLFRERIHRKRRKDIVGKGSSMNETGRIKTDIVGKSTFDLGVSKPLASKSEPLTATSSKSEKSAENPNIFVPTNEEKPSAEVPAEELDEVFSDTPSEEDNERMDIDYPLEYEAEENDEPEEETEEIEGMSQAALASGVQFEDLGNAVRTVKKSAEATLEQKQRAGDTLLEMRKTDLFEQLILAKPDAKRIVTDLMAESLSAFYERKDKESGTTENSKKAPDNFNIRDFA